MIYYIISDETMTLYKYSTIYIVIIYKGYLCTGGTETKLRREGDLNQKFWDHMAKYVNDYEVSFITTNITNIAVN